MDPFDDTNAKTSKLWNELVKGQSQVPGSSVLRGFFETLKEIGNQSPKNCKTLATGILPIAMADASGWNICEDVSEKAAFGDVFGFKRKHLLEALNDIGITDEKEVKKLLLFMRTHFNGHRFSRSSENLYNPQLCLWFMKKVLADKQFKQNVFELEDVSDTSSFPSLLDEQYVDNNLKQSGSFLNLLSQYPMTTQIVQQLLACRSVQQNPSQASFPLSSASPITLASSLVKEEEQEKTVWGIEISDVTTAGIKSDKLVDTVTPEDEVQRILSLMYFYGLVTRTEPNEAILCIPNRVVFDPLFKYFMARNLAQVDAVKNFLTTPTDNNLKKVLETIVDSLETKMGNTYSEEALQSAIEASLKQMELLGVVPFKVFCNTPFKNPSGNNTNNDHDFRFDMVLETENCIFFIEFKRLRPNGVLVEDEEGAIIGFSQVWKQDTKRGEQVAMLSPNIETPSLLERQQECLDKLEREKGRTGVVALKTHFNNPNYTVFMTRDKEGEFIAKGKQTVCETVEHVLQCATNQGVFYARLACNEKGKISEKEIATEEQLKQRMTKNVHIFGVVNISRRTFVAQKYDKIQPLDNFQSSLDVTQRNPAQRNPTKVNPQNAQTHNPTKHQDHSNIFTKRDSSTCKGKTIQGRNCRAIYLNDDGFCIHHTSQKKN